MSEIIVKANSKSTLKHDPEIFYEAYRLFRQKDIPTYAQTKYMAFKDLPMIQEGQLPGPKKKWIRKEFDCWRFNLKFFVLFDL